MMMTETKRVVMMMATKKVMLLIFKPARPFHPESAAKLSWTLSEANSTVFRFWDDYFFFMNDEHVDRVIMDPTTRTFVLSNWDRTKKICSHMPNITSNSFKYLRTKVRSLPCLVNKSVAYLIFVISFTQAKFSENKIYTEKHVNYGKIHSKLPIFTR